MEFKFLNFKRVTCCGEIISSNIAAEGGGKLQCVFALEIHKKSCGRWIVKKKKSILRGKKSSKTSYKSTESKCRRQISESKASLALRISDLLLQLVRSTPVCYLCYF